MKRKIRKTLFKLLNGPLLIPISKLFSPIYSGNGTILMFHRVVPSESEIICDDIEITVEYLEEVINFFISKKFEIISIDEAAHLIEKGNPTHRKFVVFTFDDGYIDNMEWAYPIFKKYNIPFTIYITSSFPDRTANLWWYALKDLVNKKELIKFDFDGREIILPLYFDAQKKEGYMLLRRLILDTKKEMHSILFEELFAKNNISVSNYIETLGLSWDQVSVMANDPLVTIGAHTVNHSNLLNLDKEKVIEEMQGSQERIEKKINKRVKHFAYPFGSKNEAGEREFQIAKELGFLTATTTRSGNIFSAFHKKHLTALPRIGVMPYTESSKISYYISGFIPAVRNKMKRKITI